MRTIMELLVILVVCSAMAGAQIARVQMDEARKAAVTFLPAFKDLVTEKNYKAMGFDSPKEAAEVKLGVPLRVVMVELARLQRYQVGDDPVQLMTPLDQVLYPVTVNDQTRSSVIISKAKEGWEVTEIGNSDLAKGLARLRKGNSDSTRTPLESYYVVRIPALNLEFLGYGVDRTTMLIPLFDESTYGFRSGIAMPAAKVFEAVLPEARRHDGLPR
jgi:hypothetical protein